VIERVVPCLLRRFLAGPTCVLILLIHPGPTADAAEEAGPGGGSPSSPAVCTSDSASEPAMAPSDPIAPREDPAPASPEEAVARADRPYWRKNLFGRFFRDQKYLFTAWWPSELRREGFTLPLLGGIALASTSDQGNGEGADLELQNYVQIESRGRGEGVARELSFLGDAATGAALIGAGYLIGRWSHHDRLAEASSLSAEALLSAGLWSTALKAVTARARPAGGSNGKFFQYKPGPGETVGSFPSGHATGAFTVATVFAHVYADQKWVSWVAYGTAGLIGASRVALARHFPSDVIVGGLLGNSIGRMVVARSQESEAPAATLQPYFDPAGDQVGLVWTRVW
jgi:hypothetical protein